MGARFRKGILLSNISLFPRISHSRIPSFWKQLVIVFTNLIVVDAGPHSTLLQRSAEIHGVQELAGGHGHGHHHAHHSHHDAMEGKKNKVMKKLVDAVEKSKRKRRDTDSDQRTGSSPSLPRKQPLVHVDLDF